MPLRSFYSGELARLEYGVRHALPGEGNVAVFSVVHGLVRLALSQNGRVLSSLLLFIEVLLALRSVLLLPLHLARRLQSCKIARVVIVPLPLLLPLRASVLGRIYRVTRRMLLLPLNRPGFRLQYRLALQLLTLYRAPEAGAVPVRVLLLCYLQRLVVNCRML